MKIQCDVCNQNGAAVYCVADEAALCTACDHNVHHANKLAGKHPRFSLLHPSAKDAAVCDICQEKKAFLFCQQDRAILCKDCDVAIHKVNQQKLNHHRFLLTGVKLSPTASLYSPSPASISDLEPNPLRETVPTSRNHQKPLQSLILNQTHDCNHQESNGSGQGSSISEYLIEMLPGWHVEDFLDPPPGFSKVFDNDPTFVWGSNALDGSLNGSFLPESMGVWVPQAPPAASKPPALAPRYGHLIQQFEPGLNIGLGDQTVNGSSIVFGANDFNKMTKSSRKWRSDNGNCFTVPQISPPSTANKRSRTLWH